MIISFILLQLENNKRVYRRFIMKKIFIILSLLGIAELSASEHALNNSTPGKHNLKLAYSQDLNRFFGLTAGIEADYFDNKIKYGFDKLPAEFQKIVQEAGLSMGAHPIDIATWPVHRLQKSAKKDGDFNLYGIQTPTGIWLDTSRNEDLVKFIAYHEVAHLILKHCSSQKSEYQGEFEADELAFNSLHKFNKMDIILAELVGRDFVKNNYNIKDSITNFFDKKEKSAYPTNKERTLYYKKIIENLPNKKTNLPKKVLQKNRNLIKKEILKTGNLGRNVITAGFLLLTSYMWAKEAYAMSKCAQREMLEEQIRFERLKKVYPKYMHDECEKQVYKSSEKYNTRKNISLVATGLSAGSAIPLLWPALKNGRAAHLFRKKGII